MKMAGGNGVNWKRVPSVVFPSVDLSTNLDEVIGGGFSVFQLLSFCIRLLK